MKAVVYIILISMTLHCACRLGVLDYLHQERHAIAYSLGMIAEIPIALCSSDYDFGKGLKIETQEQESSSPAGLVQAQEINLFFKTTEITLSPDYEQIASTRWAVSNLKKYSSPLSSIFHPPSFTV